MSTRGVDITTQCILEISAISEGIKDLSKPGALASTDTDRRISFLRSRIESTQESARTISIKDSRESCLGELTNLSRTLEGVLARAGFPPVQAPTSGAGSSQGSPFFVLVQVACAYRNGDEAGAREAFKKLPQDKKNAIFGNIWRVERSPEGIEEYGSRAFLSRCCVDTAEKKADRCNPPQATMREKALAVEMLLTPSRIIQEITDSNGNELVIKALFYLLPLPIQWQVFGAAYDLKGPSSTDSQFGENVFLGKALDKDGRPIIMTDAEKCEVLQRVASFVENHEKNVKEILDRAQAEVAGSDRTSSPELARRQAVLSMVSRLVPLVTGARYEFPIFLPDGRFPSPLDGTSKGSDILKDALARYPLLGSVRAVCLFSPLVNEERGFLISLKPVTPTTQPRASVASSSSSSSSSSRAPAAASITDLAVVQRCPRDLVDGVANAVLVSSRLEALQIELEGKVLPLMQRGEVTSHQTDSLMYGVQWMLQDANDVLVGLRASVNGSNSAQLEPLIAHLQQRVDALQPLYHAMLGHGLNMTIRNTTLLLGEVKDMFGRKVDCPERYKKIILRERVGLMNDWIKTSEDRSKPMFFNASFAGMAREEKTKLEARISSIQEEPSAQDVTEAKVFLEVLRKNDILSHLAAEDFEGRVVPSMPLLCGEDAFMFYFVFNCLGAPLKMDASTGQVDWIDSGAEAVLAHAEKVCPSEGRGIRLDTQIRDLKDRIQRRKDEFVPEMVRSRAAKQGSANTALLASITPRSSSSSNQIDAAVVAAVEGKLRPTVTRKS